MKYLVLVFLFLSSLVFFTGCSAFQESSEEKTEEEEIYVFDQVPEEKTVPPPPGKVTDTPAPPYYIVQIGAFTTKDKADVFAAESRQFVGNEIEVRYSESVNLYVVQVKPYFKNRYEAEGVRNRLWGTDGFQDAWIVTVQ